MPRKRVTISSIARELNITAASVSRALNDKPSISLETKTLVLRTAERLGYVNNLVANSLRNGRTMTIAIVTDNILNPYFSVMSTHMNEALKRYEYLGINFVSSEGCLTEKMFKTIFARGIDGIISYLEPNEQVMQLAKKNSIPILLLGRKVEGEALDTINVDDFKGGSLAAEHLIEKGCRRILFVSESLEISCVKDRFAGFKSVMEAQGLYHDELTVFYQGSERVIDQVQGLVDQKTSFDGIVCFNDLLAFEVEHLLRAAGLHDIKIVGYDNIQETIKMGSQLTTIGSDKKSMAELAIKVIMDRILRRADRTPIEEVFDVYLVHGDST